MRRTLTSLAMEADAIASGCDSMRLSRKERGAVVKQVWSNPSFKTDLESDPRAALTSLGIDVPDGIQINVFENDAATLHVNFKRNPVDNTPKVVLVGEDQSTMNIIIPRSEWSESDQADSMVDPDVRAIMRFVRSVTRGFARQVKSARSALR